MSQAFKCDRCKIMLEGQSRGRVEVRQTDEDYGVHFTVDLCPSCFVDVHKFVQTKEPK